MMGRTRRDFPSRDTLPLQGSDAVLLPTLCEAPIRKGDNLSEGACASHSVGRGHETGDNTRYHKSGDWGLRAY